MSATPPSGEHRPMPTSTCIIFKLIREIPTAVLDLVLGPQEQIAYVTVTVGR
jgi:hypothetical protein